MKASIVRALGVVFLANGFGFGCALLRGATRPATYAAEMAACEDGAPEGGAGWAVYTPCCVDVAQRYQRNAAFCFPPSDGGSDD